MDSVSCGLLNEKPGENLSNYLPTLSTLLSAALSLGVAGCGPDAPPDTGLGWSWESAARPALTVTVTDAVTGAGVEGAWISLPGRDAATDASGVATVAGLDAETFSVAVGASGYATSDVTEVTLDASGGALSVSLVPDDAAGAALVGTVAGPGAWESGVEGATVWVDDALVATTDAAGEFLAGGLTGGDLSVRSEPPDGASLVAWEVDGLAVADGEQARVAVTLAARPPDDALYVGASSCRSCHADAGHDHLRSAHGAAGRDPDELGLGISGLKSAFSAGDLVSIGDAVSGAWVQLGTSGGAWTAEVGDGGGSSTGALTVVEVYGGHRAGAALAVEAGDTLALLPIAWALDGQGLGSAAEDAGWVTQITDGWFNGSGRLSLDSAGRPGAEASWDLQCAGCHATGHRLVESPAGVYARDARADGDTMEREVGCEACHGPGSAHLEAAEDERVTTILNPALLAPARRVELCARCHERTAARDAPFSDAPPWPVSADGLALGPLDLVSDVAASAPEWWATVDVSAAHRDQVGDLRGSPHQDTAGGYIGACEDCHAPHGGGDGASLQVTAGELALCTSCHASAFPDDDAVLAHTAHPIIEEDRWGAASCAGCHVPRLASVLRPDAVSGAWEGHSHGLWMVEPQAAVDAFGGEEELPLGSVPTPSCLDCHLQREAEADDAGGACACPRGDPELRQTYIDLQSAYDLLFGEDR